MQVVVGQAKPPNSSFVGRGPALDPSPRANIRIQSPSVVSLPRCRSSSRFKKLPKDGKLAQFLLRVATLPQHNRQHLRKQNCQPKHFEKHQNRSSPQFVIERRYCELLGSSRASRNEFQTATRLAKAFDSTTKQESCGQIV